MTTFVKHFLIGGVDPNFGLELEDTNTDSDSSCSTSSSPPATSFNPLERSYKPRLLRKLPQTASGGALAHVNEEVLCRLLLPTGLKFCTERELSSGLSVPKAHPFLLTKEDGERTYGMALTFYERVHDLNICHAVHTLQKMYSTEAESGGGTLKRTDRIRPRSAKVNSERSRSLPRHYQQARLSASTLDLSSATYDYRKDTLYVVKAIALIVSEPLVSIAVQVLQGMHKYISRSEYDLQVLEGLVLNLLHDIPVPSPGRSVRFWCLGEAIMLSMPKVPSELPTYDYNLLDFFDILGLENAVKLFICVLLEHQVLVYSGDVDKLMLVCESVSTLLYPFAWQHVYVPILPPNLENFLDAPVPYIMGLLRRTHDIELSKKGSVCIVDIDSGELDLPEELPEFPYEKELIDEVRNNIIKFGGKDGADILKEHAIETRDILESAKLMNQSVGPGMMKRPTMARGPGNPGNLNSNSCSGMLDAGADTMEELHQMISRFETLSANSRPVMNRLSDRLRLNNALREVFAHRFAHMFLSYEHFVIVTEDMEAKNDLMSLTPQQQETQQNFDKTSFLSDQQQSHLAFLSSFLETQMFSTFIDECIVKITSDSIDESPFDVRLNALKERFGESLVRTPTYETCDRIDITDIILTKRLKKVELTVTPQKRSSSGPGSKREQSPSAKSVPGVFPLLDNFEGRSRTDNACIFVRGDRKSKAIDPSTVVTPSTKISMLNASPAAIAETNWKFVAQLLKECKNKTKRILLEKLGQEAIEWGHGEVGFSGSEENMLVASVCDLIERIWSHGLQNRHGKSSLWHFLSKFGRANEKTMRFKGTLGTQAFYVPFIRSKPFVLPDHSRDVQVVINPMRKTPTFDSTVMAVMHNVSTIREIKTEIGYARAWIRLALERKSLSKLLQVLVSDPALLKNLYKRYGFLRCEDEREQSLYYLQTLTTVEFSCFTNAYTKSSMLYQVLIFPSSKSGMSACTANIWMHVVGSHGETKVIHLPRGVIHFSFWAKNLGVITSLRLAHDNAGSSPNWLVEHVLLRNEFTGQAFKFTCGRWLGQGVDDGSTERYLVGDPLAQDANIPALVQGCTMAPEVTCPALPLKPADNPESDLVVELQTKLGDAINRIIKFYHKSLNERLISYAQLMCGRDGLVHVLISIFSYGYKSTRIFGRNLAIWDFFLKVTMDFNTAMAHNLGPGSATNSPMNSPKRNANTLDMSAMPRRNSSLSNLLDSPKRSFGGSSGGAGGGSTTPHGTMSRSNQFRRMYTKLITRIETTCARLGKDDKFQLFVCLAAHDRLLGKIISDLTKAVAAQQLYDETAFLRNPSMSSFLSHILVALEDISVPVDPAMKMTLEQHYNY